MEQNPNIDIYSTDPTGTDNSCSNEHTDNPTESVKLTGSERLDKLEEQLQNQRSSWGKTITELVKQLKNIDDLTDAQITMLSHRQVLVDVLTKFRIRVSKLSAQYDREYKRIYLTYFNNDYILNQKEKDAMATGDLSLYTRQIGLLDAQVNFFQESIKTIDQMAWAIKNRIKTEEI